MVDVTSSMRRKKSAFSLLEIMIAVMIIGVIGAIAGPAIWRYLSRAKETATKQSMQTLKQALMMYNSDMGAYPSSKEGLEVLIQSPSPRGNWRGPYVEKGEKAFKDGWKNDFEYNAPPIKNKKDFKHYEIVSYGAGGEEAGEDSEIIVGN